MSGAQAEPRLFELVLYLVSCARLALDEPPIYGSFRLLEGASRLIETAPEAWGLEVDEVLLQSRKTIKDEKLKMIEDHDGYRDMIDRLVRNLSGEAVRRNLELPPAG